MAGTFRRRGSKAFWNIRRGKNAVVITLADSNFDQLIIEVRDPYATVTTLNKARAIKT